MLQNGFGNGDQDPPGNSGPNNNAENAADGDGGKPDDKQPGQGGKPDDGEEPGKDDKPAGGNVSVLGGALWRGRSSGCSREQRA